MKGSPETVLSSSRLSEEERRLWGGKTAKWASEGHKVLACARKVLTQIEVDQKLEPQGGYEFCGLLAFEDPPRPEVAAAISYCQQNGIRVLMLTGDHPLTAVAIAKEVGLGDHAPVVGSAEAEPEKFQEEWLEKNPEFLASLDVVARCTPLQKLSIVNALKKYGQLVAVTGDGVNDVPALKAADIGIAMGERGTRSAKEVSSIVLADDNFSTIVNAIMEGRQLFANLKMSFEYLLLFHIPFVLTAALVPMFGYPLLYLPIHIVWLELIIHPTALFAFQQNASVAEKRPQNQKGFFLKADMIRVVLIGLAVTVALAMRFHNDFGVGSNVDHARAKALALLTFWSAGLVLYFTRLKTRSSVVVFFATILSSLFLIQAPLLTSLLQATLHATPLSFLEWLTTVGMVLVFLLLRKYI
jgi:Ca2+-transporting ATPase